MTPEDFEHGYAERSGLTVAQLRALGRVVLPCRCEEDGCEGWQSVFAETAADPWVRFRAGLTETYVPVKTCWICGCQDNPASATQCRQCGAAYPETHFDEREENAS